MSTRVAVAGLVMSLMTAPMASVASVASVAEGAVDRPRAATEAEMRSYVPLFTQVTQPTPDEEPVALAGRLSGFYTHVHGAGSNPRWFAVRRSGAGPALQQQGVWTSQYRNSSHTSQATDADDPVFGEAGDLERADSHSLNVFWPGRHRPTAARVPDGGAGAVLTGAVAATADSISFPAVPTRLRPPGTPVTWPFLASRGTADPDDHSSSTAAFVSWVRVDNELMKVVAPPSHSGALVTLQVERGLWDSVPAAHEAGSRVLAPAYVGSGHEGAGYPAVGDPGTALRYSVKFWRPAAYRWLADRILETVGNGLPASAGGRLVDYDTVWLDISSCQQYNLSDAYGHRVRSWDQRSDTLMSGTAWGTYQRWKLNGRHERGGGLRDLVLHEDRTRRVKFVGNNFNKFRSACDRSLAGTYDAVSLEHWLRVPQQFEATMREAFRYQRLDHPAITWVRWDRPGVPSASTDAFMRYTYGAYLLARNPAARRPQFGMTWGWSEPHALFRVDGDPVTNGDFGVPRPATSLRHVRTGTEGLYRRNFEKGRVLVNVSTAPITVRLPRPFWSIGLGADLAGTEQVSGEVTVPPLDAVFLRRIP